MNPAAGPGSRELPGKGPYMQEKARLGYPDCLRCLAAAAVVVLHCVGYVQAGAQPGSACFAALNVINGIGRWAVPVFIMLSGMFLLDPDRPLPTKKWLAHVGRIALLTALWTLLYGLWNARGGQLTLEWFLEGLISLVTCQLHYHLWFLPVLLGLYLLIPLLRAMVRGGSRRTLWYFVGLWFVLGVCVSIFLRFFPNRAVSTWLGTLNLHAVYGYVGLFLLGYLLKTCACTPRRAAALYALGALSLVLTPATTQFLSQRAGYFRAELYDVLAPNTILTAAALVLLLRRCGAGRGAVWARLSPLTLGVYLLHPIFLEVLTERFPPPGSALGSVTWSAAVSAATLVASLATSWLLRRIPRLGKHLC